MFGTKRAKNASGRGVPWEITWLVLISLLIGAVAAYRGAGIDSNDVPKASDLLPWWLVTSLFGVVAFAGLLAGLVRFSDDRDEQRHFALVAGILKPLVGNLAAGLALGVAFGWGLAVLVKGADPDASEALLVGLLAFCLLGVALWVFARLGGEALLARWHRRLNPEPVAARVVETN